MPRARQRCRRRAGGVEQRAVMLDQALERLLGQVEPVEIGVAPLELGHDAQRLAVVVEAAVRRHAGVERVLAGMAERAYGRDRGRARSPRRDRRRDRSARASARAICATSIVWVSRVRKWSPSWCDEHLRLMGEPAERGRMDDAVAVALERGARRRRRLGDEPSARAPRDRPRKAREPTRLAWTAFIARALSA